MKKQKSPAFAERRLPGRARAKLKAKTGEAISNEVKVVSTQKAKPGLNLENPLPSLRNVGPATLKDLELLGITTVEQLAQANPDELYQRLQHITKQRHDPCVWDVFAAIVHEARTGEKSNWWDWTPIRKKMKNL